MVSRLEGFIEHFHPKKFGASQAGPLRVPPVEVEELLRLRDEPKEYLLITRLPFPFLRCSVPSESYVPFVSLALRRYDGIRLTTQL